jgi:hypothetical protein
MDAGSRVTLLLLALALAVQPWSVLAAIVLVTTRRGVVKEIAYTLGWVAALSAVAALTVAIAPSAATTASGGAVSAVEVGVGVVLAIVLLVRWRRPWEASPAAPAWMARLDAMPWVLAFVLGAFLPNYLVVVAAVDQLLQAGLSGTQLAAAAAAFVLVGSLGVAAPLGVLVVRRSQAARVYESWREWVVTHSRAVSYGTGALIAAVLVVKGVVGLVG